MLLTLHGRRAGRERALEGWPGYAHSQPVRIGNGAADQHQLDGYGWVLDAAWLLVDAGHHLYSRDLAGHARFRRRSRTTLDAKPDAGIWEVRGDRAHHVHSKLMAWLALDRALRIAATHRTPTRQLARWQAQRAAIAADVTTRGFNIGLGSYTGTYGSTDLDAAVLVLPLLGLEPPDSPRVRDTDRRRRPPTRRRRTAPLPLPARPSTAFPAPTAPSCRARSGSYRHSRSPAVPARPTSCSPSCARSASPLGLYAEEMDPATHLHLGNYPQALTHAALVQAALSLGLAAEDASEGQRRPIERVRRWLVLPHLPGRPARVVEVGELLLLLERVHAPEAVVPVAEELALLDEPGERFEHQLLAGLDVVEDLLAEHEEAAVDQQVGLG